MLAMMMAMDRNRLIGADGGMPWHLPGELQYFKRVTMGKPVIMGRKTFDSIGRPLPGRANIVVTRNREWSHEGVLVAPDLEAAIALAETNKGAADEVMIIGGASLCRQAMPLTEKLYLTVIDHAFEGDTWLDSFEEDAWQELSSEMVAADDKNPYAYCCRVLQRKPA